MLTSTTLFQAFNKVVRELFDLGPERSANLHLKKARPPPPSSPPRGSHAPPSPPRARRTQPPCVSWLVAGPACVAWLVAAHSAAANTELLRPHDHAHRGRRGRGRRSGRGGGAGAPHVADAPTDHRQRGGRRRPRRRRLFIGLSCDGDGLFGHPPVLRMTRCRARRDRGVGSFHGLHACATLQLYGRTYGARVPRGK